MEFLITINVRAFKVDLRKFWQGYEDPWGWSLVEDGNIVAEAHRGHDSISHALGEAVYTAIVIASGGPISLDDLRAYGRVDIHI